MADMLSLHGWAYPVLRSTSATATTTTTNSGSDSAKRRLSRSTDIDGHGRSGSPSKTVFRARSSNALSDMLRSPPSLHEEGSLNTLKDPRAVSTSDISRVSSSSSRHPELNSEVATLSDKLIQAFNNQTILDNTLSVTRQELSASRAKIDLMEQVARNHEEDLSRGRLLRKGDVEVEKSLLRDALEDERSKRLAAEKEKKTIEQELENLTAALFEEANKMVAAVKRDRESVEQKNNQLREQIKDMELLLASHQEQLVELKSVMQAMKGDCVDFDTRTNPSTAPASPATTTNQQDSLNQLMDAMNLSPTSPGAGDVSPAPSTSFPHLIKPVCRTDIQAYADFCAMLYQTKSSKPPSRVGSGSYAGLNVMGLAGFTNNNQFNQPQNSGRSTPSSPNALSASPRNPLTYAPLKDTKFYKRVLTEDIEPTLRLDLAPGISWLTRRSVLGSICDGGLVVEPMATGVIKYQFPCALCGERRQNEENSRTHRFRTSDNDSAQRHPLCMICLEKMRACADFVSYLRLIVDGHVRIEDNQDERDAWEETIRLRERMFWSRIGGGVVPAFFQKTEEALVLGQLPEFEGARNLDEQQYAPQLDKHDGADDPFVSKPDRTSFARTIISLNGKILPEETLESEPEQESTNEKDYKQAADPGPTKVHVEPVQSDSVI